MVNLNWYTFLMSLVFIVKITVSIPAKNYPSELNIKISNSQNSIFSICPHCKKCKDVYLPNIPTLDNIEAFKQLRINISSKLSFLIIKFKKNKESLRGKIIW